MHFVKIAFLLLLISLYTTSQGQPLFTKQVRAILADAANNFYRYKGNLREMQDSATSYFYSTDTLEGTKDNNIVIARFDSSQEVAIIGDDAVIIDSVSKNKGRKILEEWKTKLITALDGSFIIHEDKISSDSNFKAGWTFERGIVSVSVKLSQLFYDRSLYAVLLYISYLPRR